MLSKHIKKIEPIIEELKGKRIEKVNGVLIPKYLYSFPNGLWLSFDLDKEIIILMLNWEDYFL